MDELISLFSSPLDFDNEKAAEMFDLQHSESEIDKFKEYFLSDNTRLTSSIMLLMGRRIERLYLLYSWFEEYFNLYPLDFDDSFKSCYSGLSNRSKYMLNSLAKFVCVEKNRESIIPYIDSLSAKNVAAHYDDFWALVLTLSVNRGRFNSYNNQAVVIAEPPLKKKRPTNGIYIEPYCIRKGKEWECICREIALTKYKKILNKNVRLSNDQMPDIIVCITNLLV